MKRNILTTFPASIVAGLACASLVAAQDRQSSQPKPELAVEVVSERSLGPQIQVHQLPTESGYLEISLPPRLPGQQPPEASVPPKRLRIRPTYEGAAVRIKLAVVFDDSEPVDAPGPKYGAKEAALASYLAQEGETVTVNELERFGFQPLALKVVPYKQRVDDERVAITLQVVNSLHAVTVVNFDYEPSPSNFYRLKLRNLSAKGIAAVDLYVSDQGGRSSQRVVGHPLRALISPGEDYETPITIHTGWRMPPDHAFNKQPASLTIGTVVFSDDTYEGEVMVAAGVVGSRKGQEAQFARIAALLRSASQATADGQQPADALKKLMAKVSSLRIDADPLAVEALLAQFPELPAEQGRTWMAQSLLNGLRQAREAALFRLKEMEAQRASNPAAFNLAQTLRAAGQQFEQRAVVR